jgi:hypothetical protein
VKRDDPSKYLKFFKEELDHVSKGTLVAFRKRLIEANMAQRLVERTIEVARETGAFGSSSLRAGLDSSSLWCPKYCDET